MTLSNVLLVIWKRASSGVPLGADAADPAAWKPAFLTRVELASGCADRGWLLSGVLVEPEVSRAFCRLLAIRGLADALPPVDTSSASMSVSPWTLEPEYGDAEEARFDDDGDRWW